ncbi:MAG: T9SS type A sorting domain-containing protein [Sphingobacteriales bacterium JAD_PAG50586_3]|nr:MAG: T9SS type A sorting domain-containing protein [Sphingobacteriales bacterium JAD_PAG50586_3]
MMWRLPTYLTVLLACFSVNARGQNLVQNPSFEQYNQCPNDQIGCDITSIPFWQWSKSGAAYANLCNFSDTVAGFCTVPFNVAADGCYQYPQDGNGYALVEVTVGNQSNPLTYRNQLQSKLLKPLDSAQCYYFSMYISLCDSCGFATDDIGVLFVNNFINVNGPNLVENFPTPQIVHLGNFITEKETWVKYEGSFTALGGEYYILIGSMSKPDSISQITVPTGVDWNHKATYWIDNITLLECDSLTEINETPINTTKIYPNPAQDYFVVDAGNFNNIQVELFDISGRKLLQQKITINQQQVDVSGLANGVYIAAIINSGQVVKREKILISR